MLLQYVSDLHLDHYDNDMPFESIVEPCGEVLALVGDVASGDCERLPAFVAWCSSRFDLVIYVPGNHECYSYDKNVTMYNMLDRIREICNRFPNVVYLNGPESPVCVYKDVWFVGSLLWSHIPPDAADAVSSVLRHRMIYKEPWVRATVDDLNGEHALCRRLVEAAIADACHAGFWPVVLTHYVPMTTGTSDIRHLGTPMNYAVSTDLPVLLTDTVQVWISGHTHHNFHTRINDTDTLLLSNQLGYPNERIRGFRRSAVVSVWPRRETPAAPRPP